MTTDSEDRREALRSGYWQRRATLIAHVRSTWRNWRRYIEARFAAKSFAMPRSTRHALLIAWSLPPSTKAGVYRPTALMRYGVELGWRFSVITKEASEPLSPAGDYLARQLPKEAALLRIPGTRPRPYPLGLPRVDGGFANAVEIFHRCRAWLADDPPNVIIATGPPFHPFVAAYLLARHFSAKLVLDYRDEWSEGPYRLVENRVWEERCLRRADRVVFTAQPQIDHYLTLFPMLEAGKYRLVPNGWDPADLPAAASAQPSAAPSLSRSFRVLSFLGNLGEYIQPDDFLATLERALIARPDLRGSIRVRFVGTKSERALELLRHFPFQEIIELLDHVPLSRAFELMHESDGLLVINGRDFARYIQGKLYYYLASRTPLLVFGRGGEMDRIVTELGAGRVCDLDPDELIGALDALREGKLGARRQQEEKVEVWLQQHTRRATTARFVSVLDELVAVPATASPPAVRAAG